MKGEIMFNKKYKLQIEELRKENLALENKINYQNQKNLKEKEENKNVILNLTQEKQELENINKELRQEINILDNKVLDREMRRRKVAAKVGGLTSTISKMKKEKEAIISRYEKKLSRLELKFQEQSKKEKEEFSKIIESQNKEINHLKFLVKPPTIEELKAGRRNRK